MYSKTNISVCDSASSFLERGVEELGDASIHPPRDVVIVLEEHAIACGEQLAADRVDVGGLRQPGSERTRRQQIEDSVDEVLAHRVLLVGFVLPAVRHELQRLLSIEHRAGRVWPVEFHAQRDERATGLPQTEVSAGAEGHVHRLFSLSPVTTSVAGNRFVLFSSRSLCTALKFAVRVNGQRLGALKQPPILGVSVALADDRGLRPRFGQLDEAFRRGDRRRLAPSGRILRRCRRRRAGHRERGQEQRRQMAVARHRLACARSGIIPPP